MFALRAKIAIEPCGFCCVAMPVHLLLSVPLITVCVWQSSLTVIPVALSFGVSDGHRETKLVTVTLTGPFDDSGKVCEHEWSVVHFGKAYCCVSVSGTPCVGAMSLVAMMLHGPLANIARDVMLCVT